MQWEDQTDQADQKDQEDQKVVIQVAVKNHNNQTV
jgi:hypothetical protein